jgi:hypothetical protein
VRNLISQPFSSPIFNDGVVLVGSGGSFVRSSTSAAVSQDVYGVL